jgi:hypothetical protein
MPRKLIPPATFDTWGLEFLTWDINMGLSYDTKNLNGSGRGLFKILSQQFPAGTEERGKIFHEARGQESNPGPPKSEQNSSPLNITLCERSCMYVLNRSKGTR